VVVMVLCGVFRDRALAEPVSADAKKQARQLYKEGVAAYDLGHYEEAADKYEKAYRLSPDPALLFNSAQAYRLAGSKQRALDLYKSFLHNYGEANKFGADARIFTDHLQAELDQEKKQAEEKAAAEERERKEAEAREQARKDELARAEASRPVIVAAPPQKPIYKRPLFWGLFGGGVAAAALAIGLGVGLGVKPSAPTPSMGAVQVAQ